MAFCPFHAYDPDHRSPFGAVPAGTAVHLRVLLPRDYGCSSCTLVIRADDQKQARRYGMFWCGMHGQNSEWWECHFRPETPGLYWYSFECQTHQGTLPISARPDGSGVLGGQGTWQLTAYDPSFQTPDWIKGGVYYQIFPDRFACSGRPEQDVPAGRTLRQDWGGQPEWRPNAEGKVTNSDFFGGDLLGIEQKLPYLERLGVTCLYLNPIFESHSNHRYDTADYTKIDPLLGCEDDLKHLCAQAAKHGIRIVLDGVFSHTGSDSVYFNREGRYPPNGAYNTQDSPYYSWYKFQKWPELYTSWWGFITLPEVHEEDPSFLEFICGEQGVLRKWLRCGVSGWRLDVADELPDVYLERLRQAVKEQSSDALILGEVWEDASNKESYGARRKFLLGNQLDSVMNYPFRNAILGFLTGGKAEDFLSIVLSVCEHYPAPALHTLMNHIGTHDTERALTILAGEPENGRGRDWQSQQCLSPDQKAHGLQFMRLASAMQYTLPGVPSVYYGDETGMEGYKDPFNRGCYPWGKEDVSLVEWYCNLGRIRKACPALVDGEFIPLFSQGDILAFGRRKGNDTILTVINRSSSPAAFPLPKGWENVACILGKKENDTIVLTPHDAVLAGTGQWINKLLSTSKDG